MNRQITQKQIGNYVYGEKFLGEGSFGVVYKGMNSQTKEVCAVKCMNKANLQDPILMKSLKNEIEVMKSLKSQHVVRMFDVLEDATTYYIVLEFCADGDLEHFINSRPQKRLPEKEAIDVLSQLLQGFKELVSLGYIHRDVKPANALVKEGVHKVADFGFATKIDTSGKQFINEPMGTPLFMAPQILEYKPYTAKSDIWSIGMMYYQMLFGNYPWPCRDQKSFLLNIKTQPLRFPYQVPISKESQDFLKQTLCVDEATRIGWQDLFAHPVVKNPQGLDFNTKPSIELDSRSIQILQSMQGIVRNNNLDVRKIFSNFDKKKDGALDQNEFYKLLQVIDPTISTAEASHIRNQIDVSKDGQIQFEEFEAIFQNYDFFDVNDKGGRIIMDLKELIKAHNINIRQIFENFDTDKSMELNFAEFCRFVRVFAPGLRQHELEQLFGKFDVDKNGGVSFEEFRKQLVHGTNQDSSYDINSEKSSRITKDLKNVIIQNKLDLNKIFKNFDKSGDGNLDQKEFCKLLQAIDPNVSQQDSDFVFGKFDLNKNGGISFQEFYETINKK